MDRLSTLRDEAGGSRDSTLDSSVSPAYLTANEDSSKYFSLSEIDTSAESTTAKDVTLTVATSTQPDNTSTINEDVFNIQNQIDAANILSGGVNIFDDHDNSPDGNNLVIDDNVELDMKEDDSVDGLSRNDNLTVSESLEVELETTSLTKQTKSVESSAISSNIDQPVNEPSPIPDAICMVPEKVETLSEPLVSDHSKLELSAKKLVQDTKVVLSIDGINVNAIDIGNNLYLYRRHNDGEEHLAAVEILETEGPQLNFRILKVRENAEGNLEVYEEIVEVEKDAKEKDKITPEKCSNVTAVNNKVQNEEETQQNKNVTEETQIEKLPEKEITPEAEVENKSCEATKVMKFGSEARKSPLVGSFTPMTFHSTPNKEGVPLTKTMVDLQLHPNKLPDMAKKTIELTTDSSKNKSSIAENPKNEMLTASATVVPDTIVQPSKPLLKQDNTQAINTLDLIITESPPKLQIDDPIVNNETIKLDETTPKELKIKSLIIDEKSEKSNTSKSLQDNKVVDASESVKADETKSINNNNAVPFGKWTGADRKEFLNKIKESKPTNINSNSNQIKKPNDLNRRDFLKKIDNARQNSNIQKKDVTSTAKSILHTDPPKSTSFQLHIPETRFEAGFIDSFPYNTMLLDNNKKDSRTEMNNQDLIDKTIMDLMEKLPTKSPQESNLNEVNKPSLDATDMLRENVDFSLTPKFDKNRVVYGKASKESYLKNTMSSGHSDTTTSISGNKISQEIKRVDSKQRDEDQSEEEILEHEPVTGDSQPKNYLFNSMAPNTAIKQLNNKKSDNLAKNSSNLMNKTDTPTIITENEFDKFARRNSVTLENQLTLVVDKNTEYHYSQSSLNKPKSIYTSQIYNKVPSNQDITVKHTTLGNDESQKKSYSSVQIAYQSLTANRQKESLLAPFESEEKKVQVVYVESTNEFIPYELNVQGQQLTTNRLETRETESGTLSSCDSIDSDFLDSVDYPNTKHSGEIKLKTKQPRKQVLTSVETPELELIEPDDLGHEIISKRKRKTEDFNRTKNHDDKKYSKSLLPKKTYLLGRNTQSKDDPPVVTKEPAMKVLNSNITDYPKSSIDSLVKAAELIENQPDVVKTLVSLQSNTTPLPQISPVKRGRGRPRKYPQTDDSRSESMSPSSQKKLKITDNNSSTTSDVTGALSDHSADESIDDETRIKENWTMGKINENILCPICNKLFRSEEVVYKHVQHCTKASLNAKRLLKMRRSSRNSKSDVNEMEKSEQRLNKLNKTIEIKEIKEQDPPEKNLFEKDVQEKKSQELDRQSNTKDLLKSEIKDVIVIEDTPVKPLKSTQQDKDDTNIRQNILTKPTTKPGPSISNYVCQTCGKTFRQMSYLIHHKLLHKNESKAGPKLVQEVGVSKSVFDCEVCLKKFRKLHHLVQHREIHNLDTARPKRKSLEDSDKKPSRTIAAVSNDDAAVTTNKGAGFRCERCDKSFRKLHHLVEHRETHDGVGKTKSIGAAQKVDPEKDKTAKDSTHPPPQCTICKKTFRKLHHLSEHKETHLNEKKGLLSKDIIHECPMCYMVFPNDYALEKHIIVCKRKRRQAAAKRSANNKPGDIPSQEVPTKEENDEEDIPVARLKTLDKNIFREKREVDAPAPSKRPSVEQKRAKVQETKANLKRNSEDLEWKKEPETPAKVRKVDEVVPVPEAKPSEPVKVETQEKKAPGVQVLTATVVKTKPVVVIDSDDDDARYMLNPNYENIFKKVRANKRSSLQIERPKTKDPEKRRISLQHPPKPRLRVPAPVRKPSVPSPVSDDSDTKYSFPTEEQKKAMIVSATVTKPKKSVTEPRRTLVAKRMSFGKSAIPKPQVAKPKKQSVEYRCDCGEVFAAATLLARHATLAHTPPRRLRTDRTLPKSKDAELKPSRTRTIKIPGRNKRSSK